MSIEATQWAWGLNIPTTHKIVLLAYADHVREKSCEAWPCTDRLCEMTGLNEKTVRRSRKWLIDAGLIARSETRRRSENYVVRVGSEVAQDDHSDAIEADRESVSADFQPQSGGIKTDSLSGVTDFASHLAENETDFPSHKTDSLSSKTDFPSLKTDRESPKPYRTVKNHKEPLPPVSPTAKSDIDAIVARPKPKSPQPETVTLPDWLPVEAWNGFVEMRIRKRAKPTHRALKLLIADLEKFRAAGEDPSEVLDQSTKRGWTGIFSTRRGGGGSGATGRPSNGEALFDRIQRRMDGRAA